MFDAEEAETGDGIRGWHLDKRVPLAIIAALTVQTMVVVSWATRLTDESSDHGRRIERLEQSDRAQSELFGQINEKLAHIDERLIALIERAHENRNMKQ